MAFEGARNITIKFCNTGTICHVSSQQIREGTVYDPLAKKNEMWGRLFWHR